MRLRTSLGIAAVISTGLVQDSSAVVRPKGAEAPIVSAERGPRTYRATSFTQNAIVDRDTGVPLRVWGNGQYVSGVVADAAVAEATARQLLAAKIGELAPGSTVADFELVANHLSPKGDIRTIGFQQRASGIRVLGGGLGFTFKHDRLIMISST